VREECINPLTHSSKPFSTRLLPLFKKEGSRWRVREQVGGQEFEAKHDPRKTSGGFILACVSSPVQTVGKIY